LAVGSVRSGSFLRSKANRGRAWFLPSKTNLQFYEAKPILIPRSSRFEITTEDCASRDRMLKTEEF